MEWLLLIIPGGIAAMGGTFAVASYFVWRGNKGAYREARVVGQYEVANAETARRAAVRAELAKHLPAQTRPRKRELVR